MEQNAVLGSNKPGRKGDPRMHRAVNARLRNPTLSLYDALREGGFVFHPKPGTDPATATEASLSDYDGILLCQRKNQLSRRLRSVRAKADTSHDASNCDNAIDYEESKELMGLVPSIAPRLTLNMNQYTLGKRKAADSFGHHFSYESELNPNAHDTTFGQPAYSQTMNLHKIDQDSSHTPLYETTEASGYESIFHYPSMSRVTPTFGPTPRHYHEPPQCNVNANTTRTWIFSEKIQTNNTALLPIPVSNSESVYKTRRRSALEYYCKESSSLLKRCMLSAGFEVQQTDEFDMAYLRFLETVIDFEKKRLDKLLSRSGRKDLGDMRSYNRKGSDDDHDDDGNDDYHDNHDDDNIPRDVHSAGTHEIVHNVQNNHNDSISHTNYINLAPWANHHGNTCNGQHEHYHNQSHHNIDSDEQISAKCLHTGKHVHRLEGRCGHKAVIHKPEGGSPHVDFVVDGKIECYHGIKPTKKDEAMWPSRYKCDEIMCSNKPGCHESYFHGPNGTSLKMDGCPTEVAVPIVLDMSQVDMQSNEWNIEFFNNDDNSIDLTLSYSKSIDGTF